MGHILTWTCIIAGKPAVLLPGHLPTTPDNVVKVVDDFRSGSLWPEKDRGGVDIQKGGAASMVPYALIGMAESEDGLRTLRSFEQVSSGGAALPVSNEIWRYICYTWLWN